MITEQESAEQVAVIEAATAKAPGGDGGEVIAGARVAPNEWLVAVRYPDSWADAVMTVTRGSLDEEGVTWYRRDSEAGMGQEWQVVRVEYGLPEGEAVREVMRRAS